MRNKTLTFNLVLVFALLCGLLINVAPAAAQDDTEFAVLANHITASLAEWTPTISADALYENL
ncbi:MAG: hypothetical protein JXD18_07415, partial [Anaerolineae bacterium]|nr:hypothetical protein [Anaerolineae bacterium]